MDPANNADNSVIKYTTDSSNKSAKIYQILIVWILATTVGLWSIYYFYLPITIFLTDKTGFIGAPTPILKNDTLVYTPVNTDDPALREYGIFYTIMSKVREIKQEDNNIELFLDNDDPALPPLMLYPEGSNNIRTALYFGFNHFEIEANAKVSDFQKGDSVKLLVGYLFKRDVWAVTQLYNLESKP